MQTIKKAFISAIAVILQAALCGCSNGNLPGEYSGVLPMPAGGLLHVKYKKHNNLVNIKKKNTRVTDIENKLVASNGK